MFESDEDTGEAVCDITDWAFVRGFAQGKRRREPDDKRFNMFTNMVKGVFEGAATLELTKEEICAHVSVGNQDIWNVESSDEIANPPSFWLSNGPNKFTNPNPAKSHISQNRQRAARAGGLWPSPAAPGRRCVYSGGWLAVGGACGGPPLARQR